MGAGATVHTVLSAQDSALHSPMPKPRHVFLNSKCSLCVGPSPAQWHGRMGAAPTAAWRGLQALLLVRGVPGTCYLLAGT